VAVLARAIDRGQTQCPNSLLPDVLSEGEGTRGGSADFDQIGWVWFRKMKQSSTPEPVMIRPVTVAVIAWIESPLSASSSSKPVIFSFSKKVGSDLDDLALL
jgi:hypothetical protein